MKEKHPIDQLFDQALSSHQEQPSAIVWSKLEAAIPARKKFPWKPTLIIACIAGLSGLGLWLSIGSSENSSVVQKDTSNPESIILAGQSSEDSQSTHSSPNNLIADAIHTAPGGLTSSATKEIILPSKTAKVQDPDSESAAQTHAIYPGELNTLYALNYSYENKYYDHSFTPREIDYKLPAAPRNTKRGLRLPIVLGAHITPQMMYYADRPSQPAITAEISVDFKYKQWSFQTGAGFQRSFENGAYEVEFQRYDSIGYYNKLVDYELNPEDPTELLFVTEEETVFDSVTYLRINNTRNQFDYLTIPLGISYRFYERHKISIYGHMGAILLIQLNKKIEEPDLSFEDVTGVDTKLPFRNANVYQWNLGVSFRYDLNSKMSLAVQPTFIHFMGQAYPGTKLANPYGFGLRTGFYFTIK